MISAISKLSIKYKLLLILSCSGMVSLFLGSLLLAVLEISHFKETILDDINTLTQITANRSTAAIMFDDTRLAQENLSVFAELPTIEAVCLYTANGEVFAYRQKRPNNESCPVNPASHTSYFEQTQLHIFQPITVDGESIGYIHVLAELKTAYWRKIKFIGWVLGLLSICSLLAFNLVMPLLNMISNPLKNLVKTTRQIAIKHDYSLRADKIYDDEIGALVDAFNDMIGKVGQQNKELANAQARYRALYDNNPSLLFTLDESGLILSVNAFGAEQLQQSSSALMHKNIRQLVYAPDQKLIDRILQACMIQPDIIHKTELRLIDSHARSLWVRLSIRHTCDEAFNAQQLLLVGENITETRRLNDEINYRARHDALTDLVNRSEFEQHLQQAVIDCHKTQAEHALCYLDLDQFKVLNDAFSHIAGDELIKQLSRLLRRYTRHEDTLARLGGDEFGILMHHCSLEEAYQACDHLRDLIRSFEFIWEGRHFNVGVSIGITLLNRHSENSTELLKEADAACYAAKEKGRNRVHVYRPDDQELSQRRSEMQWVEKIQQGLEHNRFVLYGQSIIAIDGQEKGLHFETLIRYQDGDRTVPPGLFLPAAERYNLAPEIDRWVIKTLFAYIAQQPGFLSQLALCSVNLSGLSLADSKMFSFIIQEMDKWQIPSEKICFEITETAAIASINEAYTMINRLRDKGCLFSLDDFGSGLSSFAYLKNLPVDFLKIDGVFVKDIVDDKIDLAMVRSINEIGHIMGKKTIAEFVENQQIFALLADLGVDFAQGYGVGKPLPLEQLLANDNRCL